MIDIGFGITCVFTVEKFNKDGIVTYRGEPFFNTVLDCGLLSMYTETVQTLTTFVNVGTGYDTPSVEQTGLTSFSYATNTMYSSPTCGTEYFPELYTKMIRVYQFSIGTCTGDFTEVGLSKTSNTTYFNRQLFRDADGNQIIVRVASDEGLRITAEIRLYCDPYLTPFSKIFKLDLKGATSGTLTLSNGIKQNTFTYSQISTVSGIKTYLNGSSFENTGTVLFVTGDITNGFIIYITPRRNSDFNLSIVSHTLIGGLGEPELFILQEYDVACKKYGSISLNDETNEINTEYEFYTTIGFAGITLPGFTTANVITEWAYYANSGVNYYFLRYGKISDLQALVQIGSASKTTTENTVIEEPELGKNYVIKKFYYAPTKLGTGQINVENITMLYNSAYMYITTFSDPSSIAVTDIEEFEIVVKISWGRYES